MVNVPHSGLTGADLHESKGVAAAAANLVFVTDGAGSGVHKAVPAAALSAGANPFGAQLLHVREEQTQGTASTTAVVGSTWTNTVVNTIKTNEVGATLASNQITLLAGTYFIDAKRSIRNFGTTQTFFKLRWQNFTDTVTTIQGKHGFGNANDILSLELTGRFTIAATKVFTLDYYASNALGVLSGISQGTEVYSDVQIWKTA